MSTAAEHTHDNPYELCEPIKAWFAANNLDLNETPAWPYIEFDQPSPGMMRILQFQRCEGGNKTLLRFGSLGEAGIAMEERPILVPMDDQLRRIWEHCAPEMRRQLDMRALAREIQGPVTILNINELKEIVIMTRGTPHDDAGERIKQLLGGRIEVHIITEVVAVGTTPPEQLMAEASRA